MTGAPKHVCADISWKLLQKLPLTSRHQTAREETEENNKSIEIVMFDSQVYSLYVIGFGKEKEGTFKNLGLVAAQCKTTSFLFLLKTGSYTLFSLTACALCCRVGRYARVNAFFVPVL